MSGINSTHYRRWRARCSTTSSYPLLHSLPIPYSLNTDKLIYNVRTRIRRRILVSWHLNVNQWKKLTDQLLPYYLLSFWKACSDWTCLGCCSWWYHLIGYQRYVKYCPKLEPSPHVVRGMYWTKLPFQNLLQPSTELDKANPTSDQRYRTSYRKEIPFPPPRYFCPRESRSHLPKHRIRLFRNGPRFPNPRCQS